MCIAWLSFHSPQIYLSSSSLQPLSVSQSSTSAHSTHPWLLIKLPATGKHTGIITGTHNTHSVHRRPFQTLPRTRRADPALYLKCSTMAGGAAPWEAPEKTANFLWGQVRFYTYTKSHLHITSTKPPACLSQRRCLGASPLIQMLQPSDTRLPKEKAHLLVSQSF